MSEMEEEENQIIVEHESRRKKKKKVKEEEEVYMDEEENRINVEESRKKKKKMKQVSTTEEQEIERENQINIEHSKKKKKKIKAEEQENDKDEEEKGNQIMKVKIEVVHEHPEKIAPLVGYFPSGFDPHKNEDGPPQVTVCRKKDRPNRLQLVVSPKDSKVEFIGGSHSGEAAASQLCTYALGVLDKDTQTLKIVPIACNKILRLEPRVGGSNSPEKELPKELKDEQPDQRRRLSSAYKTKGVNRKEKQLEKLNLKQDAETQELLNQKMDEVRVNKEALTTTGGNTVRNIPPHDSTADTPEKAYPLDLIILKGEWDYLVDILNLLQSETEIRPDAYPSFVCNRVHKLREIKDEEERSTLACIYSYITHLIKFKDQRSSRSRHDSPAKNHRIPDILHKKFLSMFAGPENFNLPAEKIDLLISYVSVLTLIADGYKTEISDIAKDLKMTNVALRDHYINLGCKLIREGKLVFLTLPVPLVFPKLRMLKRRRK